jgi:hypothetical protein
LIVLELQGGKGQAGVRGLGCGAEFRLGRPVACAPGSVGGWRWRVTQALDSVEVGRHWVCFVILFRWTFLRRTPLAGLYPSARGFEALDAAAGKECRFVGRIVSASACRIVFD